MRQKRHSFQLFQLLNTTSPGLPTYALSPHLILLPCLAHTPLFHADSITTEPIHEQRKDSPNTETYRDVSALVGALFEGFISDDDISVMVSRERRG